jgi:uncharacterized membrane protein YccF (DUF307 family)
VLLNVVWLVLCGVWMAIGYLLAGVLCCILIITIPFGIASFRIANYVAWPFARSVVEKPTSGLGALLGNIVWFVVAGWWLALAHLTTAIALCLTIVGIPLAIANLKLIPVTLLPLGKQIVTNR